MTAQNDEASQIADVVRRLREHFPSVDIATIQQAVTSAVEALSSARVRDFVPVLAEREAKAKLRSLTLA